MTILRGLVLAIGLLASVPSAAQQSAQGLDRPTFLNVIAPELALVQDAMPAMAAPGTRITYRITVTNKRPAAAANVIVTNVLPPSTTFVSCVSDRDGICEGTGNDRRVRIASLAGGVSAVVTLVATVGRDVKTGQMIRNTASVTFEGTDPDPANNAATTAVTVAKATPPERRARTRP